MEEGRVKRGRFFDDDPLIVGTQAKLESYYTKKDLLELFAQVVGSIADENAYDAFTLRARILAVLMTSQEAMERFLGVPHRKEIQPGDYGPVAKLDKNVAVELLTRSTVRGALDLIKSIPFLARYERKNRDRVWEKIFAYNFPEYVEVMQTDEDDMWRNVTLWTHWAVRSMMRIIRASIGLPVVLEDYDHFRIYNERVDVRVFAYTHGFHKGRLLSRRPMVRKSQTFNAYLSNIRARNLHSLCFNFKLSVQRNWSDTEHDVFQLLAQVASDEIILALADKDILRNPLPKNAEGRMFLGNDATCASCGIGEAQQWFACSDCEARVCSSKECEHEHMNNFH